LLTLEPLGGYFQVRLVESIPTEKKLESGIIVPERVPDKPRIYEIVAAGPGTYNPFNGGRFDHGIRKGDLVILNEYAPVVVRHLEMFKKEPETFLVNESDIFSVYLRNAEAYRLGLVDTLYPDSNSVFGLVEVTPDVS